MSQPTPAGSPNDPANAGVPAPGSSETLADEHAVLRHNVATRAAALLSESDAGRWPQPELEELLNCLRLEVLRQVADERMAAVPRRPPHPGRAGAASPAIAGHDPAPPPLE